METNSKAVLAKIKNIYPNLFPAGQKVSNYILENPEKVIQMSITELSENTQVSEATIVRLCQSLGYKGFHELKINLAQDLVDPIRLIHEDIQLEDPIEIVESKLFSAAINALRDTQKVLDLNEVRKAVEAIHKCKHLYIVATGNSMPIAMDAAYKLLRIGISIKLFNDPSMQIMACTLINKEDVVIGISHSGSSKTTVDAMKAAHENGATTICITNHVKSPITEVSDIKLFTASKETLFKEEAMASKIAQISIIDLIYILISMKDIEKSVENIRKTGNKAADLKY